MLIKPKINIKVEKTTINTQKAYHLKEIHYDNNDLNNKIIIFNDCKEFVSDLTTYDKFYRAFGESSIFFPCDNNYEEFYVINNNILNKTIIKKDLLEEFEEKILIKKPFESSRYFKLNKDIFNENIILKQSNDTFFDNNIYKNIFNLRINANEDTIVIMKKVEGELVTIAFDDKDNFPCSLKIPYSFLIDKNDNNSKINNKKVKDGSKMKFKESLKKLFKNVGAVKDNSLALTLNGDIAVKTKDENYLVYNKEAERLENQMDFVISDSQNMLFLMPVKTITVNDIIFYNNNYYYINKVEEDNIYGINYNTRTEEKIILPKNVIIGFEFVLKVISLVNNDNSNINPLMLLAMNDDKDIEPMMLSLLLNNNQNDNSNINPLMLLAMNDDKDIDPLSLMLLNNNNSNNNIISQENLIPFMLMEEGKTGYLSKKLLLMDLLKNNNSNTKNDLNNK